MPGTPLGHAVITDRSLRNLETSFHKALQANLVRERSDVCEIMSMESAKMGEIAGGMMLQITLSSFLFRLLTIYRIDDNAANRAYYVSAVGTRSLEEVFAETANMCGGALNRDLSKDFPHLAMSTPYAVSNECIAFLGDLRPHYLSSYLITINASVRLQATLCLCCSAPIAIAAGAAAKDVEEHIGEFELF